METADRARMRETEADNKTCYRQPELARSGAIDIDYTSGRKVAARRSSPCQEQSVASSIRGRRARWDQTRTRPNLRSLPCPSLFVADAWVALVPLQHRAHAVYPSRSCRVNPFNSRRCGFIAGHPDPNASRSTPLPAVDHASRKEASRQLPRTRWVRCQLFRSAYRHAPP